MKDSSVAFRPPSLSAARVRLGVASDPWGFGALIGALILSGLLSSLAVFAVALALLTALVALAPHLAPLRRHAERRAMIKRLRRAELRRQRREHGHLLALPPDPRERYRALTLKLQAASQRSDAQASRADDHLEGLRASFLNLLTAQAVHDRALDAVDGPALQRQVDRLTAEIEVASAPVRAAQVARRQVLERRLRRLAEIRDQREVISTQLLMIEDLVSLLGEAGVASPDGDLLGDHVEGLLVEIDVADEATRSLDGAGPRRAMARFERQITG